MKGYEGCPTCDGRGTISVDWGEAACPRCRLRASRNHEIAVEQEYKAAGFDQLSPTEQRFADGDR